MKNEFGVEQRKELLQLARQTIARHLEGKPLPPASGSDPRFGEARGVFVTLHRQGELRGCIGYPLPHKPLAEAVRDNAIAAACEDPRFPPVESEELAKIDIEISILTVPQPIDDPRQVEVGRDGILVSKGFHRGLLLPQVPVEQGWNREQFLDYGCRKAGLPADEWRRGVKIETFQAEVFGERERGRE